MHKLDKKGYLINLCLKYLFYIILRTYLHTTGVMTLGLKIGIYAELK